MDDGDTWPAPLSADVRTSDFISNDRFILKISKAKEGRTNERNYLFGKDRLRSA